MKKKICNNFCFPSYTFYSQFANHLPIKVMVRYKGQNGYRIIIDPAQASRNKRNLKRRNMRRYSAFNRLSTSTSNHIINSYKKKEQTKPN